MTQPTTFLPPNEPSPPETAEPSHVVVNGEQGASTAILVDTEEKRYEVVNGRRVEKPHLSTYSIRIAFLIAHHLETFAAEHRLGQATTEALFPIDPATNTQRRPDAAFVSSERWPVDRALPHSDPWPVVPELVAEVVSPSTRAEAVIDRVAEYFRAGVQLVWYVYPRLQMVYVYESPIRLRIVTADDELDGGSVLSGFRLPLASLFAAAPRPA